MLFCLLSAVTSPPADVLPTPIRQEAGLEVVLGFHTIAGKPGALRSTAPMESDTTSGLNNNILLQGFTTLSLSNMDTQVRAFQLSHLRTEKPT